MINTLIKLALAETILKPVLISVTQYLLKDVITPLYQTVDELLVLPEEREQFFDKPYEWLYKTVLNEEMPVEKQLLARYLITQFSMKTFLEKGDKL